jgi:hypothetical protein
VSASPGAIPVVEVAGRETRLLAVGTPGGIVSGFEGLPDGSGVVKLGDQLLSLDAARYRLWEAIHVAPTYAALHALAGAEANESAESLLPPLMDAGLIVDWTDDGDRFTILAQAHSVRFIGRLLGNGGRRNEAFVLGETGSRAVARVDSLLYEFLLWTDGQASIVDRCRRLDTSSFGLAVDAVQHVVAALPVLMRTGMIQLDVCTNSGGS